MNNKLAGIVDVCYNAVVALVIVNILILMEKIWTR